jgi:hypothetical protein
MVLFKTKVLSTNGYNIITLENNITEMDDAVALEYTKEFWLESEMKIYIDGSYKEIFSVSHPNVIELDSSVTTGSYNDVKIMFINGRFTNFSYNSYGEDQREPIESIIKTGDIQFGEVRFKKRVLSCFLKGMVESSSDMYVRLISNKEQSERFTDIYVNLPISAEKWSEDEWNNETIINNGGSAQRVGYFGYVPIIADTFSLELMHNEKCDFMIQNFGLNFDFERRLTV